MKPEDAKGLESEIDALAETAIAARLGSLERWAKQRSSEASPDLARYLCR